MSYRVSIAGASGYAGGELLRLVLDHPQLELAAVAAGTHAGAEVTSIHPQLTQLIGRKFVAAEPLELAQADLVLLALPHGESAAIVKSIPSNVPVVDLGADFRLASAAAWGRYYGDSEHAGSWPYGLPELPGQRDRLTAATRVANPGCYATAVALSFAPLLASDLIEPQDLVVVAASGTSGAGRRASTSLMGSEVMGAMSSYKLGGIHQHTPEIEQALTTAAGEPVTVLFNPTLAPMPRGILATCTARTRPGVAETALRDALHASYRNEPFVHVLPAGRMPTTAATAGSNCVHLQVAFDARTSRATIVAAEDNLIKGAAGQAIQNANLILGLPEALGLPVNGVAP
jgi:N-acetyl-gamma-glutamyl-phosphate reductase